MTSSAVCSHSMSVTTMGILQTTSKDRAFKACKYDVTNLNQPIACSVWYFDVLIEMCRKSSLESTLHGLPQSRVAETSIESYRLNVNIHATINYTNRKSSSLAIPIQVLPIGIPFVWAYYCLTWLNNPISLGLTCIPFDSWTLLLNKFPSYGASIKDLEGTTQTSPEAIARMSRFNKKWSLGPNDSWCGRRNRSQMNLSGDVWWSPSAASPSFVGQICRTG